MMINREEKKLRWSYVMSQYPICDITPYNHTTRCDVKTLDLKIEIPYSTINVINKYNQTFTHSSNIIRFYSLLFAWRVGFPFLFVELFYENI